MRHRPGASQRLVVQLLVGLVAGFLLVVMYGVASADDTPTSDPALPEIELAPAVVVAAGADSIDLAALHRVAAESGGLVQRGTAVQLDDGRLATVAHALIDARSVSIDEQELTAADTPAISRQHDLAALSLEIEGTTIRVASESSSVGDTVALAGIPESDRIETTTGVIISRTAGTDYGIGRPDVYVIAASVAPGWSGGPVVNADGEVIAIIVGTETRSGVTLAVPIEYLPNT